MKPDPEPLHDDTPSYTITPITTASGNGWWLRTFVNGEEVGYRVFLAHATSRAESMAWWDGLTNEEQISAAYHAVGAIEAHQRYLLDVAYAEAETTACAWLEACTSMATD